MRLWKLAELNFAQVRENKYEVAVIPLGCTEPHNLHLPYGMDTLPGFRFEALERGWVSITRPWHLFTTNSGAGNPHAASAEKGRRLIEVLVKRMSAFLLELSRAEPDGNFPFQP